MQDIVVKHWFVLSLCSTVSLHGDWVVFLSFTVVTFVCDYSCTMKTLPYVDDNSRIVKLDDCYRRSVVKTLNEADCSRDNAWFHFSGVTNIVCSMYRVGCIIYLIMEYILFSFCSHTLGSIDPWL